MLLLIIRAVCTTVNGRKRNKAKKKDFAALMRAARGLNGAGKTSPRAQTAHVQAPRAAASAPDRPRYRHQCAGQGADAPQTNRCV